MKTLNKRTWIVLAVVGLLVVIGVAAVGGCAPLEESALSGATGASVALMIDPSGNPVNVTVGQSLTLSVRNGDPTCRWSSNSTAVSVGTGTGASKAVTGVSVATATVTASCNTGVGRKSVAVAGVPLTLSPADPHVQVGYNITLSVQPVSGLLAPVCTWSKELDDSFMMFRNPTATTVEVRGVLATNGGHYPVTATCNIGSGSVGVLVYGESDDGGGGRY